MTFDREELLSVLADAAPALAKSSAIEGFKHFWFDKDFVYAYDGGLGVQLPLETELYCGVPGKPLLDLLRTSALKEVFLDSVKNDLVLQMGKSKVNLATMPPDMFFGEDDKDGLWEFPATAPKKGGSSLILTEEIVEALNQVSFVRMSKAVQTMHHGVTVIPQKDRIELYSTDSKSMAQAVVDNKPTAGMKRFILPWGFIERILGLIEPGAVLHVLEDCLMVLTNEGVGVFSNLLQVMEEPDLPSYLATYTGKSSAPVTLPIALQPVLDRASILAGSEEAFVTLTTKGDILSLTGRYALGSLTEPLKLKEKPASDLSAKFRADLISRGLTHVDNFELRKNALIMRSGDNFTYILSAVGA